MPKPQCWNTPRLRQTEVPAKREVGAAGNDHVFGQQYLTACRFEFPARLCFCAKADFFWNELNACFLEKHRNAAIGILHRFGTVALHLIKVHNRNNRLQTKS